jgi:hypothetical protein
MFRPYDHHQAEKYITTLGLLNWQQIRCFIRSHITVIVYLDNYCNVRSYDITCATVCKHPRLGYLYVIKEYCRTLFFSYAKIFLASLIFIFPYFSPLLYLI